MALKEVKKPAKAEEEVKTAEELIKSPPPFAVPVPVKLSAEEEKLSREMDKAYDSIDELAEYSKELEEKLPVDVNYEAEKMLNDLEKTKLKEKEVMGELRYKDEAEDIEKTINSAQKAEKAGKHEDAVNLIKDAKKKMELLSGIVELQRNLAVVGAPSEVIDSVEKSYVFSSKGQEERSNLIMQSSALYLQFSEIFKTNKSYSESLTLYISQLSSDKKVDMKKSKEYFEYISSETVKLANRQALENVVKSDDLNEKINYINQNSTGELKKQTGELLNKIEDVNKRLSDEKTMGTVTDEELKTVYQSATIAMNAYTIIDSVDDIYKETQKNISTIYGNALDASMNDKTKEAELHLFAAQEYLINSENKKYRKDILSASNDLSEGKLSAGEAYLEFYSSMTKTAQNAAKKDKELGKFVESLKPPEKMKEKDMQVKNLLAIRQALIFSDYANKNIDKVDEESANQFLARGYSALKEGNLDVASAQLQLFGYYANTGYKDGVQNISKILQKEPEKGMELTGQFIFLMETNTGFAGAVQSSGEHTKEIVQSSIAYNDGFMKSILEGNLLTEEEQVTAYAVSQITFTMVESTAELSGDKKEAALDIFERSISAAVQGKFDEAMILAQNGAAVNQLDSEDAAAVANSSVKVSKNEISASDASFIDGIYQSKAKNLSEVNDKINYLEGLETQKKNAQEKLSKTKDPVQKKKLQAKIKTIEDKIEKTQSYLKYLKSVSKTAEKFYDMA
ncbi:hypothetical protein KY308_01830, partial [Candidatus Woesearchaeota archaeon]|nr:hypothetical protein [Candidatus Woesearchaeota archaeon]